MSEQAKNFPVGDAAAGRAGKRRVSRVWACAAVAIALILVLGLPLGYVIVEWTRTLLAVPGNISAAATNFAADAIRPKSYVRQIIMTTVEDMQRQSKLVVLRTTVNADVTRQEGSKSWGVYWGTNVARVIVQDARAQYCIELSEIGTADFVFDETAKTLTVHVPRPDLDKQMISIDPAKIETLDLAGGWMRWDKRDTWDHAVAELQPKVIAEAGKPLVRKEADEAGKEAMLDLLHPMADTLGKGGIRVEVRYRDGRP